MYVCVCVCVCVCVKPGLLKILFDAPLVIKFTLHSTPNKLIEYQHFFLVSQDDQEMDSFFSFKFFPFQD